MPKEQAGRPKTACLSGLINPVITTDSIDEEGSRAAAPIPGESQGGGVDRKRARKRERPSRAGLGNLETPVQREPKNLKAISFFSSLNRGHYH